VSPDGAHLPASHSFEQHWVLPLHAAPSATQGGSGGVAHAFEASQ
jgi:hypothetical protein